VLAPTMGICIKIVPVQRSCAEIAIGRSINQSAGNRL